MRYEGMEADLERLDRAVDALRARARAEKRRGDTEMTALYEADAGNLTDFGNFLKHGAVERAGLLGENLDTAARDEIPARLWNRVCAEAAKGAEADKAVRQ